MVYDDPAPSAEPTVATAPPRRRRKWPWVVLGAIIFGPLAFFFLWAAITLNWSYSKGDRVGYVLKLSEKGWLCKTWEGELSMQPMPGMVAEKFAFSVRSDSVAHAIQELQAQQVRLFYEQHKGVPGTCFGETEYFVTGVKPIETGTAPPPASPTAPPATPSATPPAAAPPAPPTTPR